MPNFNKVFLMGHLTHDPTGKKTASGKAVASFAIAINRTFHTTDGAEKDTVCFVDVVAWEALAEVCAKYLKAGSPVFVEGELSDNRWEQDGKKRKKLEVVARSVQFLSKPSDPTSTKTHKEETTPADPPRTELGETPTAPQPPAGQDLQTDAPEPHPPTHRLLEPLEPPPDLPTV